MIPNDFPDFFALDHLAKSLWRDGETRGAAVLVGSGFSRFANLAGMNSKRPPLWDDLRRGMISEIYADAPQSEIPADPLRLAEEFRCMFGQAALDDFIRRNVPDASWEPGNLHERLLRLPWADVLTTNWDTLLERTAPKIGDIAYETVLAVPDIARAKQPRIVKLHGTLPSNGPFIFAEEDYRTYPIRHAAFVNLARQIFLENELCLLGFSGNDPNFLQWSGWVRDHLGGSARRIYLVGVLNLHPATRRLLEQRNIAPVDLAPLFRNVDPAERHGKAILEFLDFLQGQKPKPSHAWSPGSATKPLSAEDSIRQHKDPAFAAEKLTDATERWRADRETYPGWLVCPYNKRSKLRYATDDIPLYPELFAHVASEKRPRVLYELAWRFDKAFWPVPDFVSEAVQKLVFDWVVDGLSQAERLNLALIVMRTAREQNDDNLFDKLADLVVSKSEPNSDFRAAVAYQQCLRFKDRLQFKELTPHISEIAGPDPAWKLRQASIRCELCDFTGAKSLVLEALSELRMRQRRDRRSLWILSRRAWAEYLAHAARVEADPSQEAIFDFERDWPLEYKAAKCDPWDEWQHVEQQIDETLRKESEQSFDPMPHFDAGTYKEGGSRTVLQSWTTVSSAYELHRLAEEAGIPILFDGTNVRETYSKKSMSLTFEASEAWYLQFFEILRSYKDALIDRYLDRVSVAKLGDDVIVALVGRISEAISFWRAKCSRSSPDGRKFDTRSVEELRLLIELMSRLVIRCNQDQARQLFDLTLELVKDGDLQHWWLLEPIAHLQQRSIEAIPPEQRIALVLPALQFPLQSEANFGGPSYGWPQPISYLKNTKAIRPEGALAWPTRVRELISAVGLSDRMTRTEAALRLCYLDEHGALAEGERSEFSAALYSQVDPKYHIPTNTDLYPFVFLTLPTPDKGAIERYYEEEVFKPKPDFLIRLEGLISIKGAAIKYLAGEHRLLPSRGSALEILDTILAWEPKPPGSPFEFQRASTKQVAREIGPCLVHSIVPTLAAGDITNDRVAKAFRILTEIPASSLLQVLVLMLPLRPELEGRVTKAIRRALIGSTFDEVMGATTAIIRWAENSGNGPSLPRELVESLLMQIAGHHEGGSPSNLIFCAAKLVVLGHVTSEDKMVLVEALADLRAEMTYAQVHSPNLAISLSIIRAECVRLAKKLRDEGLEGEGISGWLEEYEADPLPEVRFALNQEVA